MDGGAIITVSAAVVALTQLIKWGNIVADRYGPWIVLFLSFIGVAFWGWSKGTFERAVAFEYFTGWIAVSTSAAGVFGFTRAAPEAITRTSSPPPGGAGSSATT